MGINLGYKPEVSDDDNKTDSDMLSDIINNLNEESEKLEANAKEKAEQTAKSIEGAKKQAEKTLDETKKAFKQGMNDWVNDVQSDIEGVVEGVNGWFDGIGDKTSGFFSGKPKKDEIAKEQVQKAEKPPEKKTPIVRKFDKPNTKYSFPTDIDDFFVTLSFYEYTRKGINETSKAHIKTSIALPIPDNLQETFASVVQEVRLGAIVGGTEDFVTSEINAKKIGDDFGDIVQNVIKTATAGAANQGLAASAGYVLGTRAGDFTYANVNIQQQLKSAISLRMGFTENDHPAVIFGGMRIRPEQTFNYTLAPRNPVESQMIKDILVELKRNMHPEFKSFIYTYPSVCNIDFHVPNGGSDSLYKIKPSFLVALNINYAPNGVPTFFKGTRLPTEYNITMSFKELSVFTSNDF